MDRVDPKHRVRAIPYRCSSCARCFVELGDPDRGEALCTCGAPLVASSLPHGLYELRAPTGDVAAPKPPSRAEVPQEDDAGYGASHGYGPAHGGPTSPGDAPAKGD